MVPQGPFGPSPGGALRVTGAGGPSGDVRVLAGLTPFPPYDPENHVAMPCVNFQGMLLCIAWDDTPAGQRWIIARALTIIVIVLGT